MTIKITKYLIYLTIFLLPSYLAKFSVLGIPMNMLEILMLAVLASWLIFQKMDIKSFLKLSFRKHVLICIGLILGGLLASTLISGNYATGFGIIKSWFVLPLLFSWAVMQIIPSEEKKNIFEAYFLSALTVAILSLGYYVFGVVTFDGRLQGIFNSPNYLAMYLAPSIIIGAEGILRKISNKKYIISLLFIISSFFLTYSYSAWMAVLASLLMAYFIKGKKFSLRLMVAISLILLALFVSQQNTEKFGNFEKYSRSSFESRIMIWKSAGKILKDNLIFGIGPGNFQEKYLEYQKYFPPYLEWAVPHPHNLYLAWWLSGGIASFVGFLALIFFWFREMSAKEKNSQWAISLAIMLCWLLHGLVDTTYFKNDSAVVFWLIFWLSIIPAGKVFHPRG
jgi:O-antigen ligase